MILVVNYCNLHELLMVYCFIISHVFVLINLIKIL